MYKFRTIIIKKECRDKAKTLINIFSPWQGDGMFNTPLWINDEITHYITSGMISTEFADLLPLYENWELISEWNIEVISQVSWETIEDIKSLFEKIDITEENNLFAIDRLWLKIIYDLEL